MHVATGNPYYEKVVHVNHSKSTLSVAFYTYEKNIVSNTVLSRTAIKFFTDELKKATYSTTRRLYVGLSQAFDDNVVGYVLDPDTMKFKYLITARIDTHYLLKKAKLSTKPALSASHLSC